MSSYILTIEGLKLHKEDWPIIGWSPRCPNCNKRRAGWSGLAQSWLCIECGLHGVKLEEWIG